MAEPIAGERDPLLDDEAARRLRAAHLAPQPDAPGAGSAGMMARDGAVVGYRETRLATEAGAGSEPSRTERISESETAVEAPKAAAPEPEETRAVVSEPRHQADSAPSVAPQWVGPVARLGSSVAERRTPRWEASGEAAAAVTRDDATATGPRSVEAAHATAEVAQARPEPPAPNRPRAETDDRVTASADGPEEGKLAPEARPVPSRDRGRGCPPPPQRTQGGNATR